MGYTMLLPPTNRTLMPASMMLLSPAERILAKEATSILAMLHNTEPCNPRCKDLKEQLMGWTDFGASDFDSVLRQLPQRWNRLRRFILHMLALSESSLLCTSLRSQLQLLLTNESFFIFHEITPECHFGELWTIGGILWRFIERCRITEIKKAQIFDIHIIARLRDEAEELYERLPCHAERPLSRSGKREEVGGPRWTDPVPDDF
jgi:hypothetical protein